jgi:hypothetical protein
MTNEYLIKLDVYIKNKIGDIINIIVKENPIFPTKVFDLLKLTKSSIV